MEIEMTEPTMDDDSSDDCVIVGVKEATMLLTDDELLSDGCEVVCKKEMMALTDDEALIDDGEVAGPSAIEKMGVSKLCSLRDNSDDDFEVATKDIPLRVPSDISGPIVALQGEITVISSDSEPDTPVKQEYKDIKKENVEYYEEDRGLPIFKHIPFHTKRVFSVEDIVKILLDPNLKHSGKVCRKIPVSICHNAVFIVDISKLSDPDDINCDDLGVWKNNRVDRVFFHARVSENVSVEKCSTKADGAFQLKRVYRRHGTDPSLHKVTASIVEPNGTVNNHFMVIYKFDGVPEHKVLVRSHGNSKDGKRSYWRTMESTKKELKKQLTQGKAKEVVDQVYAKKGGILQAQCAGQLPRDRQQAYNIKKRALSSPGSFSVYATNTTRDVLFFVMLQCKNSEKVDRFVQEVTCAPEPMAVLCNGQQLHDLQRFCCNPEKYCILGIDPTYTLGDFSVTPTVYRHLIVEHHKTKKSPIFLGPLLVHYRKEFRNYNFFLSTLVGLKRGLEHVLAVGTDGELALVDAVKHQFPWSSHIRCFRHLASNIERYLQSNNFPTSAILAYKHDIFGWTDRDKLYHEGLVDSDSGTKFDQALVALKPAWNKREADLFLSQMSYTPKFYNWFVEHKAAVIKECTLKPLREEIGLGSPPTPFYTNDSESINAAIKEKVNYQKSEWPQFNAKMKDLVDNQMSEAEKAIIGCGEYRIRDSYKHLVVPVGKWNRMTQEQRKRAICKFHSTCVQSELKMHTKENEFQECATASKSASPSCLESCLDVSVVTPTAAEEKQHDTLSVPVEELTEPCYLPKQCIEGIWQKASRLVALGNAVVTPPGPPTKDRLVMSESSSVPHYISVAYTPNCSYKCDKNCLNFSGMQICSHVVAAAEVNGELAEYVRSFLISKGKQPANLTRVAKRGVPAGAGRKGDKPARKKKARKDPLDDDNRIPFSPPCSQPVVCPPVHPRPLGQASHSVQPKQASPIQPRPVSSSSVQLRQANQISPSVQVSPSIQQVSPSIQQVSPSIQQVSPSIQQVSTSIQPTPCNQASPSVNPLTANPWGLHSFPMSQVYQFPPVSQIPPPLLSTVGTTPFRLYILSGNITTCYGCKNRFAQTGPPNNLIVQHEEDRQFFNPSTGAPMHKKGNAYYHVYLPCIRSRWPTFDPSQLVIPDFIKDKIEQSHKDLLYVNFAVSI